MSILRLAIALIGTAAALWWAFRPGGRPTRAVRQRVRLQDVIDAGRWWLPGPIAAAGAAALDASTAVVVAAGVTVGGSARLLRLTIDARRVAELTESISRFCGLLANQATALPTVPAAIDAAAEWATGPIEGPARRLGEAVRTSGIEPACDKFVDEMGHPLARALADVLVEAHRSGAAWVSAARALSAQANDTTASMRHLVREVTAKIPVLLLVVTVCSALVAGMAFVMPDTAAWYGTRTGQTSVILATVCYAIVCYQVAAPTRKELSR